MQENKEAINGKKNNKVRNYVWILMGVLLMGALVMATTTITDTSITTTGNINALDLISTGILNVTGQIITRAGITSTGDITSEGDVIFQGKLDLGVPGVGSGLDVGEGGSYTTNSSGDTIVRAFTYDNSSVSGSRFTELTLDASNTWLGDPGDRFYVGSTLIFWGTRFELTTAKSNEELTFLYYNGTNLTSDSYMGILKDNATSVGDDILMATSEQQYVTWNHEIVDTWVTADNIIDRIPDTPEDMYWMILEVPSSGLATPPVTSDLKVRGTDFDIVSGASYPVFWGDARVERHAPIDLTVAKVPGGVTTTEISINSESLLTVFDFNGAGDFVSWVWTLPEAIDTSSDLHVTLDYSTDAADTFELNLSISRLENNTVIGSGVTPDFLIATSIVADAADTIYNTFTIGDEISIQNMSIDDQLSFSLERTDNTNAIYPMSITIHYISFSTGDHV